MRSLAALFVLGGLFGSSLAHADSQKSPAPGLSHAQGKGNYHVHGVGHQLVKVGGVIYASGGGGPGAPIGSSTVAAQKAPSTGHALAEQLMEQRYPGWKLNPAIYAQVEKLLNHTAGTIVMERASRGIFD